MPQLRRTAFAIQQKKARKGKRVSYRTLHIFLPFTGVREATYCRSSRLHQLGCSHTRWVNNYVNLISNHTTSNTNAQFLRVHQFVFILIVRCFCEFMYQSIVFHECWLIQIFI